MSNLKNRTYQGIIFSIRVIDDEEFDGTMICSGCCLKKECDKLHKRSICEIKGLALNTMPNKVISRKAAKKYFEITK